MQRPGAEILSRGLKSPDSAFTRRIGGAREIAGLQNCRIAGSSKAEDIREEVRKEKEKRGVGTKCAGMPFMDQVAENLKDRTKRFAVNVLELADTLVASAAGDAVKRQLIRAALGVVGNYRSACRARSHAEFTSRLAVVLDESDESELWLDVVAERTLSTAPSLPALLDESRQLRAMFSKGYQTARTRHRV
jgi:four helix bundle protein